MEIEITGACVIKEGCYNSYNDDYPYDYWVIVASTDHGEVYMMCYTFESESQAETTLNKILKKKKINLEYWKFHRTIYGSAAYEEEAAEAAMYAKGLRDGAITEDLIPSNLRELL